MDDGPDSFELQATGPTFLNVAMKETILHEAEPWSWHGAVVDIYIYIYIILHDLSNMVNNP